MTHNMFQILLYYKYTHINNPAELVTTQRELCERLNLKGRIIIAEEGINGTVEGLVDDTEKYIQATRLDLRFADIDFKKSVGTGEAFPRLSIKARKEIVSGHLGDADINPTQITGKYIKAEELHSWIHGSNKTVCNNCFTNPPSQGGDVGGVGGLHHSTTNEPTTNTPRVPPCEGGIEECLISREPKEFYIVDMRNDYEHKIGFFQNSILPPLKNFRNLSQILPILEPLKNKTVVTVCTGGVRCEKASGFLLQNGFNDVYQLENGIVTYMEKYPEEDFKGKLYVFDGRVTMAFNSPATPHEIVGRCDKCNASSENYVNCNLKSCNAHFICCEQCYESNGRVFCGTECV
ncbi:MAG: rhodanese domain-containing protein [Candidatus Magasanikbacteria bacterium]|nr:rhodanese domain-containing protein [Candidatus Magasanikbacteria bacterium]